MKKLPIGIQTFSKIRIGQYCYVDKTRFVADLANDSGEYYFLSRPRRFGKSLFLDTLNQAFSGNKEYFKGLFLEDHWDWSVQYPVINISFGGGVIENRIELDARLGEFLTNHSKHYEIQLEHSTISGNELEKIRACVEARIKVFMENIDYVRLYLAETRGASFNIKAGLDSDIKIRYNVFLQKLANIFESGIKKKVFKKFDPYLLAVALDGISNAFLFEYFNNPDKHPFDANLILDIFFQQVYEEEKMEKCNIKPV